MAKKKTPLDESLDKTEVDQTYEMLKAKAVPLNGLSLEPAKGLGRRQIAPIAYLDLSQRPDIADLSRVHRTDGEGVAMSRWGIFKRGATLQVSLELRFEEPVRCEFALFFPIAPPNSPVRAWLDYTDLHQFMGIVYGDDPSDTRRGATGVFFELRGTRLLEVMQRMVAIMEGKR